MHVPSDNRMDDRARQLAFMRQYSFATLVSADAGAVPCATHLPLLALEAGAQLRLLGHMARANPQWRDLSGAGAEVLAIFHGPHAYVSPGLYQRHPSVPTWNYAAVHAYGSLQVLDRDEDRLQVLRQLVAASDAAYLKQMEHLPEDYLALKLQGIVAFEITVRRVVARWKLSQDRLPQERQAIAEALEQSADSAAQALAGMMRAAD
jgi:transcriptional regulator